MSFFILRFVLLFYGLDLQSKQIAKHPVAVAVTANQTDK